MKKILAIAFLILLFAVQSFAVGTSTITVNNVIQQGQKTIVTITVAWTAHTDGSFTSVDISSYMGEVYGMFLFAIETNPGATAPQDNYDITLTDADGVDILMSAGTNRHTTTSQYAVVPIGTYFNRIPIDGGLTFNLSGNNVNSATGTAKFIFIK